MGKIPVSNLNFADILFSEGKSSFSQLPVFGLESERLLEALLLLGQPFRPGHNG